MKVPPYFCKMDIEKQIEIIKDLSELCKKHNVVIMTGYQKDKDLNYQFDGLNIFITDGSMSKRKQLDKSIGEAIKYDSSVVLTLVKNNSDTDECK